MFLITDYNDIIKEEDIYYNQHKILKPIDEILKSIFNQMPDKLKAWKDLLLLLNGGFPLRYDGYPLSSTLVSIFNEFPEKLGDFSKRNKYQVQLHKHLIFELV